MSQRQKVRTSTQPEKMVGRAKKAGFTHGTEAIVVMPALQQYSPGHFVPCYGGDWEVLAILKEGDGENVPESVDYQGATMPSGVAHFDGIYHVTLNGAIRVRDLTEAERALIG